jgi:hypothetical protein
MRFGQTVVLIKLAFVLVGTVFISGCVLLPDTDESRGVKLSDAMSASAQGDRHDLGGSRSHDSFPEPENSAPSSAPSDTGLGMDFGFGEVSYDRRDYVLQVPVNVGYSLPINSTFKSITHFTLTPLCFEDERNYIGAYVGGAIVQLQPGSLPDRAVNDTWMFEAGLTYRRYLNSSWNALSPYIAASAGLVALSWSYRNPVMAGGDTIDSDSLNGAEGSIAIGISTRRDSHFSVFGELGIGGTLFSWETNQGFDNNVFHNFGFLSAKAGVSFKF